MPSNTSDGIGTKGSKLWMGLYANCELFRKNCDIEFYQFKKTGNEWELKPLEELEELEIPYNCKEKDIQFFSPLKDEDYKEYRFSQDNLYKKMTFIPKDTKNKIKDYWPSSAMGQWDGIAVDSLDNPEFLYLFEAKAHTDEIEEEKPKDFNDKNEEDREKIVNIIKTHFDIENKFDGSKLKKGESIYYQTINRLCFLYILEEFYKNNEIKFVIEPKLIFLNFYNDKTYESEDKDKIKNAYENVWNDINPNTPSDNVYIAFVDVEEQSELLSTYNAGLQKKLELIWKKNLKDLFEKSNKKNKK